MPTGIPPKVEDCVKAGRYVPYIHITPRRIERSRDQSSLIFDDTGALVSKGLSRADERNLTFPEWVNAANAIETSYRKHYERSRAEALASHHRNVQGIMTRQPWPIALE